MKKCYRFFGGLLKAQEKWLNRMADRGYRLVRVGRLVYEFEPCEPQRMQYCVEFIGQKSAGGAKDYHDFLADMGYQVFYKNINLNISFGKVRWRPWAEKGGRIAANATTFQRELLIVGRKNDGRPFALHSTYGDRVRYYQSLRRPYLFLFLMSAALGAVMQAWQGWAFAAAFLVPLALYQLELLRLKREARAKEW